MIQECDIAVIGGGPSGLAAARSCVQRGLAVRVFGDVQSPWPNTYGVWTDALEPTLRRTASHVWDTAEVRLTDAERIVLPRSYARLDNAALRTILLEGLSLDVVPHRVGRVTHGAERSVLTTTDGAQHAARVVIDATGHRATFTDRDASGVAYQMAYGLHLRVDGHPFDLDRMGLMDWSRSPDRDPSFLYTMPLGPHELFVEETSLIAGPPVPIEVLRSRLARRLTDLGIVAREVVAEERCRIPMDPALPHLDQRVVGFGAAASLVHPATGYQLARSLRAAPTLADALASNLERGPEAAAAAAWRSVWPSDHIRSRELFLFGGQLLSELDAAALRRFFRAFFALPLSRWSGFLAGDVPPAEVARAMAGLFASADASTRWTLIRSGSGRSLPLLRSVTGL